MANPQDLENGLQWVVSPPLVPFTIRRMEIMPKPINVQGSNPQHHNVLLIHGLGRSAGSMRKMARFLEQRGFKTWLLDYPSMQGSVRSLTEGWLTPMVERLTQSNGGAPLHLVTHSMGGILVREHCQHHRLPAGSRVVMLAPPNSGSEVIDRLGHLRMFQRIMGPAAQELGTTRVRRTWGNGWTSDASLGIIAGTRSADPWFNGWFAGDHDGKVSVASTHLSGSADHLTVNATHTFLMNAPVVHEATVRFLLDGTFSSQGKNGPHDPSGT